VLNDYLLDAHARGRRTVLVIDEAQNLSTDVLEQIRLLTNLETATRKLLQIILIGQPELRNLLRRDDMRQLAQRVTARYRLEPVTREETGAYIKHRLHICGATRPIFTKSAVDLIYKLSGGIPRLINVLCDRALLGAYTEDKLQVDRRIVRNAANEVLADELPQRQGPISPRLLVGSLVLLVLVISLLYVYGQRPEPVNLMDQATAQTPSEKPAASPPVEQTPPGISTSAAAGPGPASTDTAEPAMQPVVLDSLLRGANESWSLAAWTGLFARWSVKLPAAVAPEYCVFAQDMGLSCLLERGSWGLLRQYDRPVIMELNADDGQAVPVILQHLDDSVAELKIGDDTYRLPVSEVDRYWLGDFALLLKSPPNGNLLLRAGDRGPDVAWLRQSLEAAQQVKLPAADPAYFDIPLHNEVIAFQRSHGLKPDGVVGKQTLIQLNTWSGGDVPLLSAGPAE